MHCPRHFAIKFAHHLSTDTCNRQAPAIDRHLQSTGTCNRQAPAIDRHLQSTGTCTKRLAIKGRGAYFCLKAAAVLAVAFTITILIVIPAYIILYNHHTF
jgi:hypothetical protein